MVSSFSTHSLIVHIHFILFISIHSVLWTVHSPNALFTLFALFIWFCAALNPQVHLAFSGNCCFIWTISSTWAIKLTTIRWKYPKIETKQSFLLTQNQATYSSWATSLSERKLRTTAIWSSWVLKSCCKSRKKFNDPGFVRIEAMSNMFQHPQHFQSLVQL